MASFEEDMREIISGNLRVQLRSAATGIPVRSLVFIGETDPLIQKNFDEASFVTSDLEAARVEVANYMGSLTILVSPELARLGISKDRGVVEGEAND
jgi:hypothetical protein